MSITIIKKGIADSVQDLGRYGFQHLGIQPNGAMDFFSAQLGNYILKNEITKPVIECYFPASVFSFDAADTICITGANFIPLLNEKSIAMNEPVDIKKGDILQFLKPMHGRICYLSFSSKIADEPWLLSHSHADPIFTTGYTLVTLTTGSEFKPIKNEVPIQPLIENIENQVFNHHPIHFIPGPAWKDLSDNAIQSILTKPFTITGQSNRMGYQLNGPLLQTQTTKTYLSAAVTKGTLQLLPNGQIIVLMADHQTIGGYPNLGQIILVDLPRFAQMSNDQPFHFSLTNVDNAQLQYQQLQAPFAN
jgi:antagonist of KipI